MNSEGASSNFCIPKFKGHYEHGSLLMENLLRSKDNWSIIESEVPADSETLTATQKKARDDLKFKDLKAKNYLFVSLDKSILKTISKRETAKQIWDLMKKKHQENAHVHKTQLQRLKRSFEVLMMKNGESITDYFGRVMLVANEMRNCGGHMQDDAIEEKILRTLTEKWNFVVCSIEESKDMSLMSVDTLMSSLLVHDQKFRSEGEKESSTNWS